MACGSCLLGTKEFIYAARRWRKAVGGGLRQSGFLAAGMQHVWRNHFFDNYSHLAKDHDRAAELAGQLSAVLKGRNFLRDAGIHYSPRHTNMLLFELQPQWQTAEVAAAMLEFFEKSHGIRLGNPAYNCGKVRLVTHMDWRDDDIDHVVAAFDGWINHGKDAYGIK